jgi:hypothetical protein
MPRECQEDITPESSPLRLSVHRASVDTKTFGCFPLFFVALDAKRVLKAPNFPDRNGNHQPRGHAL